MLHCRKAGGFGGHLVCFIEKLERRERGGGGGAGGGFGKCELIGSKRILMFTAAFGEQHSAHIWYWTESAHRNSHGSGEKYIQTNVFLYPKTSLNSGRFAHF